MKTAFGIALAKFRGREDISQARLAERADFDHSYISRLESGARMPARDAVDRICDALNLRSADSDELLSAAGFLPASASVMLSCPLLNDLDQAYRLATPERKAWIESWARLALEAA